MTFKARARLTGGDRSVEAAGHFIRMLLPSGYRQNPLTLAGAKVTLKAIHRLPPEVKPFPAIFLEELTVGWAPRLLPSLPQSPFCSSAVAASDLPPWAFCWAPGCPHRVTSGPGMSSPWRNGTSSQFYQHMNKPTLPDSLQWGRQREGWECDELGGRSEGGEDEQKG